MGYYTGTTQKKREFIDNACPVKIGDTVEYLYYEWGQKMDIAEVVDIRVYTKRDMMEQENINPLLFEYGILTVNTEVGDDPVGLFKVFCRVKVNDYDKRRFHRKKMIGFHYEIKDIDIYPSGKGCSEHEWIVKLDK